MSRLTVNKTYKLYIGGAFPRSESGKVIALRDEAGELMANVSCASKKDARNAVVAARRAQAGWQSKTAYLKGQIIYRIAEMLEARAQSMVEVLERSGMAVADAQGQVAEAVDALVYFAGWSDKYQAVFSSVNPVASPHYNFSTQQAMGVVVVACAEDEGLLGVVRALAALVVGGNTAVLCVPISLAMVAMEFAEILHTSDVPAGVVSVLTTELEAVMPTLAGHMDVNGLFAVGANDEERSEWQGLAAENLKRVHFVEQTDCSPWPILDFQELKTTWHPVA